MIVQGKIIAPVRMRDVQRLLGENNEQSLGKLCLSDNINIWSKNKPILANTTDKRIPQEEDDFAAQHYGLSLGTDDYNLPTDEALNNLDNLIKRGDTINVKYNKPTDGPYRLSDFENYDHFAPPPASPAPTIPENMRRHKIYTADTGQEIAFPKDYGYLRDYVRSHTEEKDGEISWKYTDTLDILDFAGVAGLSDDFKRKLIDDIVRDPDTEEWEYIDTLDRMYQPAKVQRACRFYDSRNLSWGMWEYSGYTTDAYDDSYRQSVAIDPLVQDADGIIGHGAGSTDTWRAHLDGRDVRVIEMLCIRSWAGGDARIIPIPGLDYIINWQYIDTMPIPDKGTGWLKIDDETEYQKDTDGNWCIVSVDFSETKNSPSGTIIGALDYYDDIRVCIANDIHGDDKLAAWREVDMKSLDTDDESDNYETAYSELGKGDRIAQMRQACTLENCKGEAFVVVICTKDGKNGYLWKRIVIDKAVSCFGTGEWLNAKPWSNTDKWKLHKD